MQVERTSMLSGKTTQREIDCTPEQLLLYKRGALIQEAFPNLSAEDREFLMTGVTPEEWNEHFRDDDE